MNNTVCPDYPMSSRLFEALLGTSAFAHQFQRLAAIYAHTARAYVPIDDLLDTVSHPPPVNNQDPIAGSTRGICCMCEFR